jgi:hypothetical protein
MRQRLFRLLHPLLSVAMASVCTAYRVFVFADPDVSWRRRASGVTG